MIVSLRHNRCFKKLAFHKDLLWDHKVYAIYSILLIYQVLFGSAHHTFTDDTQLYMSTTLKTLRAGMYTQIPRKRLVRANIQKLAQNNRTETIFN